MNRKFHMNPTKLKPASPYISSRALRLSALAVAMLFCFTATASTPAPHRLDAFAQCLATKKATMYGSFRCPHCDDQRALFGDSFRYVPYVECSVAGSRSLTFACEMARVRYTPTWIFADGERRVGMQTLQQLSAKTGCPLP